MNFQGNNYLSLAFQTGISFALDISLNNITGVCNLGFTGNEKSINFEFNKGRILDPEKRFVSFYKENEIINLSGNISQSDYSYYINDNLICSNGKKSSHLITGYYINLTNCSAESNIKIFGKQPPFYLDWSNRAFDIRKNNYISGSIFSASVNEDFTIYSGSITVPTGFKIINMPKFITNFPTNYITIDHYDVTSGQAADISEYEIQLNLFTNFGEITKTLIATGIYPNLTFTFDLTNVTDFFSRTGIQNILGNYKDNDYVLNFINSTGRSPEIYNLNKDLVIELSYFGGKTGEITGNIIGSGYRFLNLTGFLSGSGYVSNTGFFNATGYHGLSGVQVTRNIAGSSTLFSYATGYFPYNLSLPSTGYQLGSLLTGLKNYEFTGFTSTGVITYNSNLSNIFYHKLAELDGTVAISLIPEYSLRSNSSGTIFGITSNGTVNPNFSTGCVYIYTGNQITYSLAKIYSGLRGDRFFGTDLCIGDNDKIFISTSRVSGVNNPSGRVYILNNYNQNLDSNTFNLQNTGDFGASLAINSGNILFVGAITDDIPITGGAVYVYSGENNWVLKNKLTGMYNFGRSIETNVDGSVVLIGGWSIPSGEISVFTGDMSNNYQFSSKLDRSNLFHGIDDYFGLYNPSLNRDGTVAAVPAYGKDILYIYTGNKNVYAQTTFISGNQNSLFGRNVSLNRSGTSFAVDDNNTIDIYSGSNASWSRTKEITSDLVGVSNLGSEYGLKFINYDNINLIFTNAQNRTKNLVINDINFSGYINNLIATGVIQIPDNYLLTGLITGQRYTKSFFDVFNVITGYYLSGFITGLTDFKVQNKVQGNKYYSSGIINSGIERIFVQVKTRNYFDTDNITGNLILSGSNIELTTKKSINQRVTGIN